MTLNLRIALVSAACIILSSFFGSYKSFQVHKNEYFQEQTTAAQSVVGFAAQNIEQKLQQMEAAVSYLDQSTIETLKRLGARFFAYAYQKEGEWSVKWKKLGALDKEAILQEVNPLPFSELSTDKRHWVRSQDNDLIYIVPVGLAESHQLKNGFLVFGMSPSFFNGLKSSNENYALMDAQMKPIHGELSESLITQIHAKKQTDELNLNLRNDTDQGVELLTAQFFPKMQVWLMQEQVLAQQSFVTSSFFTYFVLTSLFGVLLLLILVGRKSEGGRTATTREKRVMPFSTWLSSLKSLALPRSGQGPQQSTADFTAIDQQERKIADFADFLDQILVDELPRLNQLGISIKTQVEEGASVFCAPQKIRDFIQRLIGNSVLSLEGEKEKEIQIQLVEQAQAYQLIYVDTRSQNFPTGQPTSLMAQTEGSLQGIDGIIAYAAWLFGDDLTVAKKGFCLSIDIQKVSAETGREVDFIEKAEPMELVPMAETLDRIEINDADTDIDMIGDFAPVQTIPDSGDDEVEEPKVSFDDVIEQFRMKEFSFAETSAENVADSDDQTNPQEPETTDKIDLEQESAKSQESEDRVDLKQDDKGLFEFNSGQFKIKIRSPKKRDADVNH